MENDINVEVSSEILQEGDNIVISPTSDLVEGTLVTTAPEMNNMENQEQNNDTEDEDVEDATEDATEDENIENDTEDNSENDTENQETDNAEIDSIE